VCGLTVALPKEQATLTPAFVKALTDAMNQPDTYFEELMAKVVDGGAAEDDFAVSGWMAGRCGCAVAALLLGAGMRPEKRWTCARPARACGPSPPAAQHQEDHRHGDRDP
jgi:hypothetical protein